MRIMIVAIALLCAGCANMQPPTPAYSTASGKPEVIFKTNSIDAAKAAISDRMLSGGAVVSSETASQITFDAPASDFGSMMVYGSHFNRVPNARITYSMVALPTGVRVVATAAMITNPGSAFETASQVDQVSLNQLQSGLESIADQFEPRAPALDGIPPEYLGSTHPAPTSSSRDIPSTPDPAR